MLIFMGCLYSTGSKVTLLERFSFVRQKGCSHLEAKQEFPLEFYTCSLGQPTRRNCLLLVVLPGSHGTKIQNIEGSKKY